MIKKILLKESFYMDQYTPLNLYTNYEQAALNYPSQQLILDEVLPAFPELPLETTYAESLAIIQQRAYQLARCGVQARDKVVIFKSPKFDTYLLATAVSYLGAIPVMVSYHFPVETMTVFVERLEDPFILFDDQTANVVQAIEDSSDNKQLFTSTNSVRSPTASIRVR
jgi:acyl-coenzyme A synthetase/AMP-(fatty) acid ligase